MTERLLTIADGEAARGIVTSLRMYLNMCHEASNDPNPEYISAIAFAEDPATQAIIQVIKES